jgi:hypothetical protein
MPAFYRGRVGAQVRGSFASPASSEYIFSELNKLLALFIKVYKAYVIGSFAWSDGSE